MEIIQTILLVVIAWFIVTGRSWSGMQNIFSGKRQRVVLDSCSLIDGRIAEVVTSGFLRSELVIPQFILNELQMLADGHDSHKRERARFGLDIAHQLQDASPVPVVIDRTLLPEVSATDDKLVVLAKKLDAQLYTTDYNLAKVASIEGVSVLNINELAQQLRPIALPGEALTIKIVQKGSNPGQGVGYLDDGTMIVVENAAKFVGRVVPVTVTRMHQTVAGKMVFGQVQVPQAARSAQADQPKADAKQPASAAATTAQQTLERLKTAAAAPAGRAVRTKAAAAEPKAKAPLRRRLGGSLRRRT